MEFRVLGPLEVLGESGPIHLGGQKQRAVLAHLLLRANRVVSNDELIEALWPDEPPAAPLASIHTYVSSLRRAVGAWRIEKRAPGYAVKVAPDELDATRFESLVREARRNELSDQAESAATLEAALGLWRGPAYADLEDDPRLRAEAARLENLRLTAVENRMETLLATGRDAEAVEQLEDLTRSAPTRERFWMQLMLGLYRSGRRGDALETYLDARRAIVDALGVEPSPELRRLHVRMLRDDPTLELRGRPLRGYVLVEKIGEGTFGAVHRAVQPEVGRDVAVKVIHDRFAADPQFIRRFEREAQVVARLEHPHIVPLYDYWRDPSGAYLVMRYMRGGNLEKVVRSGDVIGVEAASRLVDDLCSALAFAHRQAVVHRDVRPPNVLFDDDGNAYLSDFGIALSPGTPYYASPEEVEGGPLTAATDIYSLGLLMFDVLAGRGARPVDAALPPVSEVRQDLPRELDAVLRKATARDAAERHADVSAFAAAFRDALKAAPARIVAAEVRNPYKGLRPFLEADASDFYGRKSLVDRLAGRVKSSRFLALVGPSGSGKSSLVQAGLLPALRAEGWYFATMHPGSAPFAELAAALDIPDDGSDTLLVIDQFEEVFTLVADEETRARFLDHLREAVTATDSRLRVVLTLRADFYDRPLLYRAFGDLLAGHTEAVTALSIPELQEAIVEPARGVGVEVEPELLAEVVAQAGDQPSLPLLQYALTELIERRTGQTLTAHAFREMGGLAGSISRRADAIYSELDERQKEAARQVFLRLVTLSEEGMPETRRRVLLAELADLELGESNVRAVLDRYGAHRLLTFDRDAVTRGPTVEVAHEALLREWGRLRGWVESALEDVRAHRRLVGAAREWEGAGREASFLLTGAKLEQTEVSLAGSSVGLTTGERAYVEASVARREEERATERARKARELALEKRSRGRLRALVAIFAVAAVLASGLSVFAVNQQSAALRQARLATARELANAAQANLAIDPERSILLALRAVETTRRIDAFVLPEAEEMLHQAIRASRATRTIPRAGTLASWGGTGDAVAFARQSDGEIDLRSATTGALMRSWQSGLDATWAIKTLRDGRILASANDGVIRWWDPSSGGLRLFKDLPDDVWGLSASADSSLVAGLWWDQPSESSTANIFDVATGRKVQSIRDLESPLHESARATSLSPDGRLIAIARALPDLQLYDVASGRLLRTLPGGNIFQVNAMAWSPDGKRLATVGQEFVRLWDVASGSLLATLLGHTSAIKDVDWSRDGKRIVTASDDGTARVWDSDPHSGLVPFVLAGHGVGLTNVAFSPDGDRVVSVDVNSTAKVWNLGFGADAEWMNLATDPVWYGDVTYTPDGSQMVGSDLDGKVKIWNANTGEVVRTLAGHGGTPGLPGNPAVATIAVSPDGSLIATGGRDDLVKVWRASTGELVQKFTGQTGWIEDVRFSSDGRLLLTAAGDGTARVIDLATGGELLTLRHDLSVLSAWFGAGDKTLITADGQNPQPDPTPIRVWDYPSGKLRMPIKVDGAVHSLAVNRARTLVAAGFLDGTAHVWELATGRLVATMRGHTASLFAIAFSPDGRRLATGSDNGEVKLWDVVSGANILSLPGHGGPVGQVIFSADGKRLVSSGGDGKIRVWALDLNDLVTIAQRKLTRTFTPEECRQYLHQSSCV